MLVRILKKRRCTTVLLLIVAFVVSGEISNVKAHSLMGSCNTLFKYDFTSPIKIINNEQEWNLNNQVSSCNFSVKIESISKKNIQPSFIIKLETNAYECGSKNESLLLNIINDDLLSKQSLCEVNNKTVPIRNFILINSSQDFLINLVESNADASKSFPFKLIKSITITSFIYASKSKIFILFIFLLKEGKGKFKEAEISRISFN